MKQSKQTKPITGGSFETSDCRRIFSTIANTFDTNENKENNQEFECLMTEIDKQFYGKEQIEIFGNFLKLMDLTLEREVDAVTTTKTTAETTETTGSVTTHLQLHIESKTNDATQSKNDTKFRVVGTVSLVKRQIILEKFEILDKIINLYNKHGIDAAISFSENVNMFEQLNNLGIDLSSNKLLENGFCKHESGIFDSKFIIFTLQEIVNENRDGETGTCTQPYFVFMLYHPPYTYLFFAFSLFVASLFCVDIILLLSAAVVFWVIQTLGFFVIMFCCARMTHSVFFLQFGILCFLC